MDIPVYRPINLLRALPRLIVIILIALLLNFTFLEDDFMDSLLLSFIIFTAYRYIVRYTVMLDNVRGIRELKKGNFDGAIKRFEKTVDFFTRHRNLNKFGFILFLSASKYTYLELGLLNLAFSHTQNGDIKKAKKYYMECLELNPKNGMALTSLNLIKAAEKAED